MTDNKDTMIANCQVCNDEIIKAERLGWIHQSNGRDYKDNHFAWAKEGTIKVAKPFSPDPAASVLAWW